VVYHLEYSFITSPQILSKVAAPASRLSSCPDMPSPMYLSSTPVSSQPQQPSRVNFSQDQLKIFFTGTAVRLQCRRIALSRSKYGRHTHFYWGWRCALSNTRSSQRSLPRESVSSRIKMHCTGVCHTDLHARKGDWPLPHKFQRLATESA
jgi:hypothetical protein